MAIATTVARSQDLFLHETNSSSPLQGHSHSQSQSQAGSVVGSFGGLGGSVLNGGDNGVIGHKDRNLSFSTNTYNSAGSGSFVERPAYSRSSSTARLTNATSNFTGTSGGRKRSASNAASTLIGSATMNGDSFVDRSANGVGSSGTSSRNRSYSRSSRRRDSERAMYVRAKFTYHSDDPTSLSFESGDIIQVMTRLESGWWDGIVNGQRGWFPSNYCELVPDLEAETLERTGSRGLEDEEDSTGYVTGDDEDDDDESVSEIGPDSPRLPLEGTSGSNGADDEASFWVPQATPEGRLYYFNMKTGVQRAELPLESPTSPTESGPREGNIALPESTKPPPEVMASGFVSEIPDRRNGDADGDSILSERDGEVILLQENANERGDFGGESSRPRADTYNSVRTNGSSVADSGRTLVDSSVSGTTSTAPTTATWQNFSEDSLRSSRNREEKKPAISISPYTFYGENTNPSDWEALVEDIHHTVDEFKYTIRNSEKHMFVIRAEAISDRLRLLVAAGSGTTDNHSGGQQTAMANRDYYPHFKKFMASYSKLVLSCHLAASDWPPEDAQRRCLAEADEIMNGVYAFAEAAKVQSRQIPRLRPGFIIGSDISTGWKSGSVPSPVSSRANEINLNESVIPKAKLDEQLADKLEKILAETKPGFRRLEATLKNPGTVITREQQEVLGAFILQAATAVVDSLVKYFDTIESIDLAPFIQQSSQSPTFVDFIAQKQRITDTFADLIMSCQYVTAPLADEWYTARGEGYKADCLVDRLSAIKDNIRHLENNLQAFTFTTQLLVSEMETKRTNISTEILSQPQEATSKGRPQSRGRVRAGSVAPGLPAGNETKIARFFGEEAAANKQSNAVAVVTPTVEENPWYLGLDHQSASEIQFGPRSVKGGTLVALVEQLTRHDYLDREFVTTFLLTYQSFTSASELFNQLAKRFVIQPPVGLTPTEHNEWIEKKQKLIRFRVFSTLKQWLESYWMEPYDEAGQELLKTILQFTKDVMLPQLPGAQALVQVLNERIRGQDPKQRVTLVLNISNKPPPILPKSLKKIKFLDVEPLEFARQLTIMESKLYQKIKPSEFLNKSWSNSSWDAAPNVKAMILHSNRLTNWVADMVLKQGDVRKRVSVIKHFISIAERCRQLNNFSTVTGIISALGASPIFRLTRTWNHMHQRSVAIYDEMRKLMGTTLNYQQYRENLHEVNPPCVPFLGVYLKDLTFVADGNPDIIRDTDLINFDKRIKTASIIQEIQQYQSVPYPLELVEELQAYILSNMEMARDINTVLFEVSKELEPRPEREDEKIARLLQESGFL